MAHETGAGGSNADSRGAGRCDSKAVIVTDAGSGIGAAAASRFSEEAASTIKLAAAERKLRGRPVGRMSPRERMTRGDRYDPRDPELVAARRQARALIALYNATAAGVDLAERSRILRRLLGRAGEGAWIEPPFQCDYGFNIALGRNVYMNFNCVILDVSSVAVGDNVLFGPGVQLYTAGHPLDAVERRAGLEWGKPITIGDDVWIGGNAVVVPGTAIGPRTVVAAGSVVTHDLPADVVAAGNPCRVIRATRND